MLTSSGSQMGVTYVSYLLSIQRKDEWDKFLKYRVHFETMKQIPAAGVSVVVFVADETRMLISTSAAWIGRQTGLDLDLAPASPLASSLLSLLLHYASSHLANSTAAPIDTLCTMELPFAFMSSQHWCEPAVIRLYDEWAKCWHLCYSITTHTFLDTTTLTCTWLPRPFNTRLSSATASGFMSAFVSWILAVQPYFMWATNKRYEWMQQAWQYHTYTTWWFKSRGR